MRRRINKQNNDKFKFKKKVLLQSGIIPLSFLLTSGLFCKHATQMKSHNIFERLEKVESDINVKKSVIKKEVKNTNEEETRKK